MNASVFLCRSDDLPEGHYREFGIDHGEDTVFLVATRHRGRPRAWFNVCPHQGRALNFAPDRFLTDEAGNLVCCAHGAVFEPEQGVCIAGPCRNARLRIVDAAERHGEVFVNIPA